MREPLQTFWCISLQYLKAPTESEYIYVCEYICMYSEKRIYIYIFWKKYRLGIHTHIYTYIYTHTFFNLEIHYGCFCYFLEKSYTHTHKVFYNPLLMAGYQSVTKTNLINQSTWFHHFADINDAAI